MRTTMDGSGRIVIPKVFRDRLGLVEGCELEVEECDGRIQIEPRAAQLHLEERDGVVVAVPGAEVPVLTTEKVREALERARR